MDAAAWAEHLRIQETHWWHRHKRDVLVRLAERAPYRRVLEIGSGGGSLLEGLRPDAFKVSMDIEREHVHGRGAVGRLPTLCFKPGSFDLVVLSEVLEHLERPVDALRAVLGVMADGGRLLITVPAWPSLWSDHDVFYGHVKRYTARALRDELSQAGFPRFHLGWLFSAPLVPAAVWRMIRKACRSSMVSREQAASDFVRLPDFANQLCFQYLKWIERPLAERLRLPAGLTCLAVAHKEA